MSDTTNPIITAMASLSLKGTQEEYTIDEPILNGLRTIQIVYSTDSALSILAAAHIKRTLALVNPDSIGSKMYTVNFQEIGSFRVIENTDAYIWIDVETHAVVSNLYPDVQSIEVRGNGYNAWDYNFIHESICNYSREKGLPLRYYDDSTKIVPTRNSVNVGILLSAMCAFNQLAPEIEIPDVKGMIESLSDQQADVALFYSREAKTDTLLFVFSDVCTGLAELGHNAPANLRPVANSGSLIEQMRTGDFVALFYHNQFINVRKQLMAMGVREYVVTRARSIRDVDRTVPVITSRINEYFWLARRIVELNGQYFHNARLVREGVFVTTNLPSNAVLVHKRMEVVNQN